MKTDSYNMEKNKDTQKTVSILSYFLVGIIWYFADEKIRGNPDTKFHVKQALNLGIFSIAINIIFSILWFLWFIDWIIQIGILVLWIIGLVNAINMKKNKIPLIGEFAEKYLTF